MFPFWSEAGLFDPNLQRRRSFGSSRDPPNARSERVTKP